MADDVSILRYNIESVNVQKLIRTCDSVNAENRSQDHPERIAATDSLVLRGQAALRSSREDGINADSHITALSDTLALRARAMFMQYYRRRYR